MSDAEDEEAITTYEEANKEGEIIFQDVTEFMKKAKAKKEYEESDILELKEESKDLNDSIDWLIKDVQELNKENNAQVKFLDNKKKSLISKLNNNKKQMEDQIMKMEKQLQKKAEKEKKAKEKASKSNKKDKSNDKDKKDEKDNKSTKSNDDNKSEISENIPEEIEDEEYKDDFEDEIVDKDKVSDKKIDIEKPKPQPRKKIKENKEKKDDEKSNKSENEKEISDEQKEKDSNKKKKDEKEDKNKGKNGDEDKNGGKLKKKDSKKKSKSKEDIKVDDEEKEDDKKNKEDKKDKEDNEDKNTEDKMDKDDKKKEDKKDKGKKEKNKKDKVDEDDEVKKTEDKKDKDNEKDKEENKDKKNKKENDKKLKGSFFKKKGKDNEKDKKDTKDEKFETEVAEEKIDSKSIKSIESSPIKKREAMDDIFPVSQKLIVTKPTKAEQEDDLTCETGDILEFIESCEDEEFIYVKNSKNKEGYVPLNSVKVYEIVEEKEEENVETITTRKSKKEKPVKETVSTPQHTVEKSENKTQNLATMFHVPIKDTDKHDNQREISDALKRCGNLPSGFRYSTLSKWSNKDYYSSIRPKFSKSILSFNDLHFQPDNKRIRPNPTRIQRCFQIVKAFQMSTISEEFIVTKRFVKICLFDKEKPLSNIHTIRPIFNEKDPKLWTFNSKITDSCKSVDFNEMFIRSDKSSTDICILLEFCITGHKNDDSLENEELEFSCGWCTIPLCEENGQVINSKNGDYRLNGGTPYEEDIELDPESKTASVNNRRHSLFGSNTDPTVQIKIYQANRENKEFMEDLPSNIIGSVLHLPLFAHYRRILAREIIDNRQDLTSAEPIYSPFLVAFQDATKSPDILDIFRTLWLEKYKNSKTLNKKEYDAVNQFFQEVFMEYIYPATKLTDLPEYKQGDMKLEKIRHDKLMDYIQKSKENKLAPMLSGEFSFSPMVHNEFSFKMINANSKCIE